MCSTYGGVVVGRTQLATLGHLYSAVFRHRAFDLMGQPQVMHRVHPHRLLVVDRVGTPQAFTNWVRAAARRVACVCCGRLTPGPPTLPSR
jgi:hypothetical protein